MRVRARRVELEPVERVAEAKQAHSATAVNNSQKPCARSKVIGRSQTDRKKCREWRRDADFNCSWTAALKSCQKWSACSYWCSRVGEQRLRQWVGRHGKWLTLSARDVDRAQLWFLRPGAAAVFERLERRCGLRRCLRRRRASSEFHARWRLHLRDYERSVRSGRDNARLALHPMLERCLVSLYV